MYIEENITKLYSRWNDIGGTMMVAVVGVPRQEVLSESASRRNEMLWDCNGNPITTVRTYPYVPGTGTSTLSELVKSE